MRKVFITISVIILGLAALILLATLSACGWNFNRLLHPEVRSTCEITDDFSDIEISVGASDIKFVATDGEDVRVELVDGYKVTRSASVIDGILKIGTRDERQWYEYITIIPVNFEITVYLPEGEWGKLNIDAGTGDIEIPKDFSFESVCINASTGDISFESSVVGNATFNLSTGDIEIKSESVGELAVSVSTGDVEIESTEVLADLSISASTGSTELESVIVEGKLSVECSTGDVNLIASDAKELFIKTSTGDVKGTLLSPKIFYTETSTGRVNVPRSTEGGICEITTTTGNIKIELSK